MNTISSLDALIDNKLTQFHKNEVGKNLNPFYIDKDEIVRLLNQKNNFLEIYEKNLKALCKLFSLNELEKEIVAIIFAPLYDGKYQKIYAYLQDDLNKKEATVSLIVSLLSSIDKTEIYLCLQVNSPLIDYKIVEQVDRNATTFHESSLQIAISVQHFLLGCYRLDENMVSFSSLLFVGDKLPTFDLEHQVATITKGLQEEKKFIVHLASFNNSKKEQISFYISNSLGFGLLKVDMLLFLESVDDIYVGLSSLFRESVLSGTLIYFDQMDEFINHEKFVHYKNIFISQMEKFSWISFFSMSNKNNIFLNIEDTIDFYLPLENVSKEENSALWYDSLRDLGFSISMQECKRLSYLFSFTSEQVMQVVHKVKSDLFFTKEVELSDIHRFCREIVTVSLPEFASVLVSDSMIDDIVLQKSQKNLIKEVMLHYKHQFKIFEEWGFKKSFQSQGLGVLFTGSPGTGKTMAASILANELGLDLYRIDLSQVISKYIGETEKNLSKLFDEAQNSGIVLFFDEADAIFGKRTQTKDSHDRYANIEVSYLLQKIEEYDGLVILASNFRQNIDDAFLRRMRFVINFPFPDFSIRKELWGKVFPKNSPLDKTVDFSILAKEFSLTGANIRNIALFAAFVAAEENKKITMTHIVHGLKIELSKIGKSFKEEDFTKLLKK